MTDPQPNSPAGSAASTPGGEAEQAPGQAPGQATAQPPAAPAGLPAPAAEIARGYAFTGPALDLGTLLWEDTCHADAPVRIPLGMLNRHGLVSGATGTGKTKTLQLVAEQLSAQGVRSSSPTSRATSPACRRRGSPARRSDSERRKSARIGRPTDFRPSSTRWAVSATEFR